MCMELMNNQDMLIHVYFGEGGGVKMCLLHDLNRGSGRKHPQNKDYYMVDYALKMVIVTYIRAGLQSAL